MHEHDFVTLFTGYWWLLFPLGWGVSALIKSWQRSRQTEKAMDIIKGYADQGKEPPADVLKLLQPDVRSSDPVVAAKRERERSHGFLLAGLIFVALSVAFGVLMQTRVVVGDPDGPAGLLFVTVLMGGFAVAFFIAAFVTRRDAKRDSV